MQPFASPVPSAPSSALYGLGAFQNSKKGDNFSFEEADIGAILYQVQHGTADERELAIDILVNLAAGKDGASAGAQFVLRALYADPYGMDESDPPVSQQTKDDIRHDLSKAAHRMCELALTDAFQPKDGKGRALSVTVAYLGALHPDCAADFKRDINQYVHSQMENLGDNESNEDWLAPQRTVSQAELLCAGPAYGDTLGISESAVNLALDVEESLTPKGAQAVQKDFEQSMTALTKDMQVGECRATWVHTGSTGSTGYAHWMPMVVKRTGDENFEFVLLNTDGKNQVRATQIKARFEALASAAGPLDASWTGIFVTNNAQARAGHGCAPLGHEFLKSVGEELDKGSDKPLAQIADECTQRWEGMSVEDLTAMVQGNRAELVSARAQWGGGMVTPDLAHKFKPMEPKPGEENPKFLTETEGPEDASATSLMEDAVALNSPFPPPGDPPPPGAEVLLQPVLAPSGVMLPSGDPAGEIQPTPPAGPPPLDDAGLTSAQKSIKTDFAKFAQLVNLSPPGGTNQRVGDDFQKLSQRVQNCLLSAPRDKNNGAEVSAHAKAMGNPEPVMQQVLGQTPPGLQKFARATMEHQVLDHRLKNSPLLEITQFAEKSAPKLPDLNKLGFGAVLSQGPTRFHELLEGLMQNAEKDVASLAKGKPAIAFGTMAKDVPAYMGKRLQLLHESVQRLDAILAAKPPLLGSWAGMFNGRVSVHDPQVQADAKALRAVLLGQIAALEDADGAPQALLAFAKAAESDPDWARTVFMAQVRPAVA